MLKLILVLYLLVDSTLPQNPVVFKDVGTSEVKASAKDIAETIESIVTSASIVLGGAWVFYRFVLQKERYANINFSAEIRIIGKQDGFLILELNALIENKGKALHKMQEFIFDLNALYSEDKILINDQWGNQVNFPHAVAQGSFLPGKYKFFFIDPGTTAKYSYIARAPEQCSFLILHSQFKYVKRGKFAHTAECTIKVGD